MGMIAVPMHKAINKTVKQQSENRADGEEVRPSPLKSCSA